MLSSGSYRTSSLGRLPVSRVQPSKSGRPAKPVSISAAAAQYTETSFRRPDVPAEEKGHREQSAKISPQQTSSALLATGHPRSALEQVQQLAVMYVSQDLKQVSGAVCRPSIMFVLMEMCRNADVDMWMCRLAL